MRRKTAINTLVFIANRGRGSGMRGGKIFFFFFFFIKKKNELVLHHAAVSSRKWTSNGLPSWVSFLIGPSKTSRPSLINSTGRPSPPPPARCGWKAESSFLAELADRLRTWWIWFGIQSGGRLVEDQHVGFVQEHLGHADPLAIAARACRWACRSRCPASKARPRRRCGRVLRRVSPRASAKKLNKLRGRHVGIEGAVLGQIAQPG